MEKEANCENCPCSSRTDGGSGDDLDRVKSIIKKLDSSIRDGIQNKAGSLTVSDGEIQLVNFTNLSGMCGDKVIGANVKLGDVYFHVYILDEGGPQVVKIIGPKDTSVKVTGFT